MILVYVKDLEYLKCLDYQHWHMKGKSETNNGWRTYSLGSTYLPALLNRPLESSFVGRELDRAIVNVNVNVRSFCNSPSTEQTENNSKSYTHCMIIRLCIVRAVTHTRYGHDTGINRTSRQCYGLDQSLEWENQCGNSWHGSGASIHESERIATVLAL